MKVIFSEDGLPTGQTKSGQQIGVLCVDDSQFILKQISQILGSRNFNIVDTALNGAEALIKYKERQSEVQLITLDITMPEMDGLTTLKKLREMNPNVNVIMVTALGTAETVKEAIKLGAKGYIVKPLNREKVLERIGKIFS
ncbi:two-component system, chemotaxis family, response regulator CheY [Brevinema andersonii]|uniref:Two-component system, chemotaxis family, response regulator CheY n=1 Tax=Brevinema andersonii TaxID=34097 RepID=A0A1I1D1S2_BREAD|nr:response regulator [Brevinema andersonii]SFB67058.1 two-component system, chemotaxis family, response regulator CheY [Brevinema andersonii]